MDFYREKVRRKNIEMWDGFVPQKNEIIEENKILKWVISNETYLNKVTKKGNKISIEENIVLLRKKKE